MIVEFFRKRLESRTNGEPGGRDDAGTMRSWSSFKSDCNREPTVSQVVGTMRGRCDRRTIAEFFVKRLESQTNALSEEKETGGTLTLAEEVTEYVEEDPSE
ncbi:hypothetical protein PGTUg99_008075 [Puccinia graminis f. sp. tritici]|uniref:Uncharacterized protein n=1 Tax=Puccinia graminis f. sp. tritici TaxID=56615 RepID=A0A5B0PDK3_PUCGR|nr:hypothetical protein PGTUg99_008075 [Puccinia graminis f. sp. tritici]